jgi:uncharacterized protein
MRALLDINVIISLLDPDHVFHAKAHAWWNSQKKHGWASSALTENGVVRIMSHPNYSQKVRFTTADLIQRLRQFAANSNHQFWPDDISLRDPRRFDSAKIVGSSQITDLYLLALATKNRAALATFDQGISLPPVPEATPRNLIAL